MVNKGRLKRENLLSKRYSRNKTTTSVIKVARLDYVFLLFFDPENQLETMLKFLTKKKINNTLTYIIYASFIKKNREEKEGLWD